MYPNFIVVCKSRVLVAVRFRKLVEMIPKSKVFVAFFLFGNAVPDLIVVSNHIWESCTLCEFWECVLKSHGTQLPHHSSVANVVR